MYFDAGDSLNLNQQGAADGSAFELRNTAPVDVAPVAPAVTVSTQATRVRMISYYIDNVTNPLRPRLVRRINNGGGTGATTFNNLLGTAVAFDVDNLQITYDLADGALNPTNVKMVAADFTTAGRCAPSACSRNQIRKINILLSARSRLPLKAMGQYLYNRLQTQVSLRSLSFVDKYR
jgi:hypothetical protein